MEQNIKKLENGEFEITTTNKQVINLDVLKQELEKLEKIKIATDARIKELKELL